MSLCFHSLFCSGEQTGLWLGFPLSVSCSDKAWSRSPPTPAAGGPGALLLLPPGVAGRPRGQAPPSGPPPPGKACVTGGPRTHSAAAQPLPELPETPKGSRLLAGGWGPQASPQANSMRPRFCCVWATGQCPASKRQEEAFGPHPCPSGDIKGPARGVAGGREGAALPTAPSGLRLWRERRGGPVPPWGPQEAPHGDSKPPPSGLWEVPSRWVHPLGARVCSQPVAPDKWQGVWWGLPGTVTRPHATS